jgi:hypothetical protein
MGIFNWSKKQEIHQIVDVKDEGGKSMMFSVPFMKVNKGDQTKPFVSNYFRSQQYVHFGADNLYPQILEQSYFTSQTFGSIIDFITGAVVGGGYSWVREGKNIEEKVSLLTFEKYYKIKTLFRQLTQDYLTHRRLYVKVCKDESGKVIKLKRLSPADMRHNDLVSKVYYSRDWTRGLFEVREFDIYTPGSKLTESIFMFQDQSRDIYAIPRHNSILNWCSMESELSVFTRSNMKNAVYPSIGVRAPQGFKSEKEAEAFKQTIAIQKGEEHSGNVFVVSGMGLENTPEIIPIPANQNDKLFEGTHEQISRAICMAFSLDPAIMGVKMGQSLGISNELKYNLAVFEKNIIMPLKDTMEDIFNDLIDICKIPNSITINDYKIVDGEIFKDTEEKGNKEI